MAGIIAGLYLYFSLLQLAAVLPPLSRYLLLGGGGGGARAELWQHPPLFGGFAASVLDRGLAGFWGGWWHQTFRLGFVAPVRWLWPRRHRHPHEGKGRKAVAARQLVEVALAFALSGVLHAAGGWTSVSRRAAVRPHTPVVFFLLQAVGVVLQTGLCSLLQSTKKGPRWVRRLGNLAFTAVWLQATGHFLVDDMSRAGLWLFEPVSL
ncbi:hypothetical protein NEMBOFW57_003063 [Staphylotrichum longicolle]|uniref:Wax synthase domain-containing protein n=1 Tax=Staphylotrichum longicolle TaxID=669026 RepID=A0AAD4F969_9PEZI|nr:hypothetical protein NEMBOFW57_003063 [Staphylotrichum longicolle]